MRMQALWAELFLRTISTTMPSAAPYGMRSGWLGRVAIGAFWIAVWEAASLAVGSQILLAGPLDTLIHLASLLTQASFWATLTSSFGRIALGFAAGFLGALLLGICAHGNGGLRRLLAPAFDALKSIPLVCIIVLLLLWVGSRHVSVLAVFLVVFPAIYFCVLEGLDAQKGGLSEELQAMGVSRIRIFLVDTWQQLLSYLVAASRNACGMAWKAGVAAEVIGTPRNTIGEAVYQSKLLLETADLFAWTIVVVLASWACERLFLAWLRSTGPRALHLALVLGGGRQDASRPEDIVFDDVTIGYAAGHARRSVASGLSLVLPAGGRYILRDASGAGKTTFLRTLANLQAPLAGTLCLSHDISLMGQDAFLVEALDAPANVMLCCGLDREDAQKLLGELLPEEALVRPVAELSGGQRRRVELVRALAHPSAVVLLDEPFASLDEKTHQEAAAFILRHLAGRTLVAATHAQGDRALLDAQELELFGHQAARGEAL